MACIVLAELGPYEVVPTTPLGSVSCTEPSQTGNVGAAVGARGVGSCDGAAVSNHLGAAITIYALTTAGG